MKVSVYKCDECKKLRQNDVDHWWLVCHEGERLVKVMAWELASQVEVDDPMSLHACGQACLLRMVSGLIGASK
jgi:hypothetical protein